MKDPTRIEISLSKIKLAKLLSISACFLITGLWMIIKQPHASNSLFNSFLIKNIVAFGGTLVGMVGIYLSIKKINDKQPGLIIDTIGVTDNSNLFSTIEKIPWSDVLEIREKIIKASFVSKQKVATLILRNPEEYIAQQTNPFKRMAMTYNLNNYRSIIDISTNGLEVKHPDLMQLLTEKFTDHRKHSQSNE